MFDFCLAMFGLSGQKWQWNFRRFDKEIYRFGKSFNFSTVLFTNGINFSTNSLEISFMKSLLISLVSS